MIHKTTELTILLEAVGFQAELYNGLEAVRVAPLKAELTKLRLIIGVMRAVVQENCNLLQSQAGLKGRPMQAA